MWMFCNDERDLAISEDAKYCESVNGLFPGINAVAVLIAPVCVALSNYIMKPDIQSAISGS